MTQYDIICARHQEIAKCMHSQCRAIYDFVLFVERKDKARHIKTQKKEENKHIQYKGPKENYAFLYINSGLQRGLLYDS